MLTPPCDILHATGYDASSLLRISDNSGTQHILASRCLPGHERWSRSLLSHTQRDEEGRVSAIVHQRGARINVEYTEAALSVLSILHAASLCVMSTSPLDGRTHLCAVYGDAGTRRYGHDATGLIHRVVASTGAVGNELLRPDRSHYRAGHRIRSSCSLPLPAERHH